MTDKEDSLARAEVAIEQLIDHIISGRESFYFVYSGNHTVTTAQDMSAGPIKNYDTALEVFNSYSGQKWAYIALATRIGTSVIIKKRGI